MSMKDLDKALALIGQNADLARVIGERGEALVRNAEDALSLDFPPTYRKFVSEVGAASMVGEEFYGVIDDNFTNSSVPDAIWLNLRRRDRFSLPEEYFVFYNFGDGRDAALDTAARGVDGECPVVELPTGFPKCDEARQIASDFGEFILRRLEAGLENWEYDF